MPLFARGGLDTSHRIFITRALGACPALRQSEQENKQLEMEWKIEEGVVRWDRREGPT